MSELQVNIQMVDLQRQYHRLQNEIDAALLATVEKGQFINGPEVKSFAGKLADYLDVPYVIPCANGTDALQIALMALTLKPGDEVIVPAFCYVAAAEVVALLGLTPYGRMWIRIRLWLPQIRWQKPVLPGPKLL